MKQILAQTQDSWLAFRDYDGRQLVYFTHLATYHCALLEIRYSVDATKLDQRFPVPKCNPLLPFNIGGDDKLYLEMGDPAKSVAVQLVFDDNTQSGVFVYTPCPGAGDQTCAVLAETRPDEAIDPGKAEKEANPNRSAPAGTQ